MDLNRVSILGRLTQDPEVRTTPGGQNVASLTVATNRYWTDKVGNKQEKAEFHNCVLWGRLADIASQYLSKGRRVFLEGRVETRDWVGKDGVKRYRTEIIGSNLIMLDGSKGSGSEADYATRPAQAQPSSPEKEELPTIQVDGGDEINVEDIPF
jgi:single-strand DNA-binding protein